MNHRSGSSGSSGSTGNPGSDLQALSPWADELAQTFVSLSSDIALVMDAGGVISNVAQAGGAPMAPGAAQWIGRSWAETVTADTRRKIDLLLGDVAATGLARRREVSHPGGSGSDIPVAYTAIRLGAGGPVLAVGRDLRAIAAIQQQFLDAQHELERGYWRARQGEARARMLRQVAGDALLVLDAHSAEILSCNAAARARTDVEALPGLSATRLFDGHSRAAVEDLLATARSGGRPVELRARLAGSHLYTSVAATPFRTGEAQRLLFRLRDPLEASAAAGAVVVVDSGNHVRACNEAFNALVGAPDEAALVGRDLADWLGDEADPLHALLAQARREGLAERDAFVLRGPGAPRRASVSCSWLAEGDQEGVGLVVRPVGALDVRAGPAGAAQRAFRLAWEALDGQLGHASLTQLMSHVAALAERHFIEAALQRCDGDAAAAARLLGVSRDNLSRRRRRTRDSGKP